MLDARIGLKYDVYAFMIAEKLSLVKLPESATGCILVINEAFSLLIKTKHKEFIQSLESFPEIITSPV